MASSSSSSSTSPRVAAVDEQASHPWQPGHSFHQAQSQSPPFPDSPALQPVSPRGFSNISSLACSLEMARTPQLQMTYANSPSSPRSARTSMSQSVHQHKAEASSSSWWQDAVPEGDARLNSETETQALMQMLSIVGSRFFEAEREGIVDEDDEDGTDLKGEGGEELSGPSHSVPATIQHRASKGDRIWPFARTDLHDDQATPTGGQTPMAASVISQLKSRKPTTSSFKTQSEIGPEGRRKRSLPSRKVGAGTGSAAEALEESDDGADGDSEESAEDEQAQAATAAKEGDPEANLPSQNKPTQLAPAAMVSEPAEMSLHEEQDQESDNAQLMSRLRPLFDLEATEELLSAHQCWMFRSILLQGHIYLTTGHLCFYAYMPSRENRLLRSGTIGKLTRRTRRFSKHWATLKSGLLSWFDSQRDPYFPQGHIDLRKVSSVEPSAKNADRFKVNTPYRRFTFQVDTEENRNAWVSSLRKEVFRTQNEGESVKISIPFETIIDVDTALSVDKTEMVCVKVVDEAADFAIDEYFFLHLSRRNAFIDAVRAVVFDNQQPGHSGPRSWSRLSIRDSTNLMQNTVTLQTSLGEVPSVPISTSLKRQSSASSKTSKALLPSTEAQTKGAIDIVRSGKVASPSWEHEALDQYSSTPRAGTLSRLSIDSSHTYPPSPSSSDPPASFEQAQKEADRGWAVPKWIKDTPAKVLGSGTTGDTLAAWMGSKKRQKHRKIVESWPNNPEDDEHGEGQSDSEAMLGEDMTSSAYSTFSVLDAPEEGNMPTTNEPFESQFQETFGFPHGEVLMGHVHATLFRVLPITGRVYVSTNHLAFRSSGLASKTVGRTLMVIPLSDIVSAARHQAFRYGQHGFVITVRGHEEVFLEVSSSERRDELLSLIELQLDHLKARKQSQDNDEADTEEKSHALILRDLSERIDCSFDSSSVDSSSVSASDLGKSNSLLRSDTSALLGFKPSKSLYFTMLTIGSRGDVQPYISLAKGLQADGHRVRIATHGEFGDWVKGHGIEFREIGGDPAELMRICVENGTFTVAFLRESVTKFRGWLDDLLVSCWEACQDTDVIIESPSAIAGIHVAEALQVPYYRAFTMPWTRTRAYPHAFAVPGNKAGGNYNYMSYVIFDQIFWRASAGQINRWRKNTLRLQSTNLDKLEQHKCPFIYNFSPSLVPRPLDWFEWIHVTGFWFLDNPDNSSSQKWQPPADLVVFIDRARSLNRKLVYIGWGSIVVSDAEAMTQCVLRAVQKSGVCAIISKGWSDRLSTSKKAGGPPPLDPTKIEDVFQVSSVPHDWLFPLIDAACHHGGAGTLGASLRAGLPTIIKPYFGDQFFWGQQVESLGVGSCVKNMTADNLAAALKMATTNAKQIERARALGAQIKAEDGVGEAIKAIYRDLDYANSRIKRDTRLAVDLIPPPREVIERTAPPGSAEHTSDEWSDVGASWSPSMSSSQDGPSSSLVLDATAS